MRKEQMIRRGMFFALISIFLVTVSPAHAGEEFLVGRIAKNKAADEYSVRLRSSKFSGKVWCYKRTPVGVQEGSHPICGINDRRKPQAMSMSAFVGKSSISSEDKMERALEQVLASDNYKLALLGEKELSSGMVVSHYRVSWAYSSYKPYISVVKFIAGGNMIFAVFFNGGAEATNGVSTPIKEEVEDYLNNRRLGPAG